MPIYPQPLADSLRVACPSRENCSCTGPCPGYDTRNNCPPFIVLAILAVAQDAAAAAA